MRYVILGAGAVGGALGARLADAGHDVVLLARGEHAAVMRRDGLRVETPQRTLLVHPPVVETAADLRLERDDVLVLAVKSQQTQSVLDDLAGQPVAGDAGNLAALSLPLICAQNGVANEPLALRRFDRVYGACVVCPAEHLEPGVVMAPGEPFTGSFDTGCYPDGSDEVAAAFARDVAASSCLATARPDVMAWKYAKLLRNLGNALDALLGNDLDDAAHAVIDDLAARAKAEGLACYAAAGITAVSDEQWDGHRFSQIRIEAGIGPGRGRGGSSTWQSVTRGTGNVEVDYLNGEIVLLGRQHGIATPVNRGLQRAVNVLAARGGQPGELSAEQLRDTLA